jgi:hydrogenase nickel incorporation protein HypA/HybF
MHEIGLCSGIVDAVVARAGDRPVVGVRVRAGVILRAEPDAMRQAFALVAAGSIADGAALELVTDPVAVTCRTCGGVTTAADALAICGRCGSADVDLTGGDALVLESLTFAAPAATGTWGT